ncbi:hypothetical protein ACOMHN_039887 [Nucella lapillus]
MMEEFIFYLMRSYEKFKMGEEKLCDSKIIIDKFHQLGEQKVKAEIVRLMNQEETPLRKRYEEEDIDELIPNTGYMALKTLWKIAITENRPELLIGPFQDFREHTKLLFDNGEVSVETDNWDYDELGAVWDGSTVTVIHEADFYAFVALYRKDDKMVRVTREKKAINDLITIVPPNKVWKLLIDWMLAWFIPYNALRCKDEPFRIQTVSGSTWKKVLGSKTRMWVVLDVMKRCLVYTKTDNIHRALSAGYKYMPTDLIIFLIELIIDMYGEKNPPKRAVDAIVDALRHMEMKGDRLPHWLSMRMNKFEEKHETMFTQVKKQREETE